MVSKRKKILKKKKFSKKRILIRIAKDKKNRNHLGQKIKEKSFQNNTIIKNVLLAGSNRKNLEKEIIDLEKTKKYSKNNLTHIDAKEFLKRKEDKIDNYKEQEINISYKGKPGEDNIEKAKEKLSEKAISDGFRYVTNMEYSSDPKKRSVSIKGKGLKLANVISSILILSGILFMGINQKLTGSVIGPINFVESIFTYIGIVFFIGGLFIFGISNFKKSK